MAYADKLHLEVRRIGVAIVIGVALQQMCPRVETQQNGIRTVMRLIEVLERLRADEAEMLDGERVPIRIQPGQIDVIAFAMGEVADHVAAGAALTLSDRV